MFIVFVFTTSTIPPHKSCHKYGLLWLTDYGDDRDDHDSQDDLKDLLERDRDRNDQGNQDDHKDPQERELLRLADEDMDGEQRKASCQRERRCLLCSGIPYEPDLLEDFHEDLFLKK